MIFARRRNSHHGTYCTPMGRRLIRTLRSLSPTLLGLLTAATLVQPGYSADIHQLVFTENSDTSLSVTFDGSSAGIQVIPESATDTWAVALPFNLNSNPVVNWREPDNSGLFNFAASNGANLILVASDSTGFEPDVFPPVPDGTAVNFSGDARDGVAIQAVFHDLGDTTGVPEPASLTLLGSALLGFGVIRRRRKRGIGIPG